MDRHRKRHRACAPVRVPARARPRTPGCCDGGGRGGGGGCRVCDGRRAALIVQMDELFRRAERATAASRHALRSLRDTRAAIADGTHGTHGMRGRRAMTMLAIASAVSDG